NQSSSSQLGHHGQSRHDCLLEYDNENKHEILQSRIPSYRVERIQDQGFFMKRCFGFNPLIIHPAPHV
ncbi:hypothetical protein, partial [Vibrio parahaemolyticus]|uniref:hypothetical protein n=1 Tax=Vibrio parahaemolyticus TaxID=670 RepID=UPI0036F3783E